MNVLNLPHSLDTTSVAGHTLSAEEAHVVRNALLILQGENHFRNVYFMGKVFGVERDYYVAFGYGRGARSGRSFYYSNNQQDWFVLGEPSPCALKLTSRVSQKFTGDPSHLLDWRDAGDMFSVTGRECLLKEEDRLGAVVYLLHEDCAIAPKGALFQNMEGLTEIDPTFQGLSLTQGSDPKWWMHTQGKQPPSLQSSDDILGAGDALKDDWSFRIRAQGSVCVVLSLKWFGFVAYHRLRTAEHGFVYFGDGIKAANTVQK